MTENCEHQCYVCIINNHNNNDKYDNNYNYGNNNNYTSGTYYHLVLHWYASEVNISILYTNEDIYDNQVCCVEFHDYIKVNDAATAIHCTKTVNITAVHHSISIGKEPFINEHHGNNNYADYCNYILYCQ